MARRGWRARPPLSQALGSCRARQLQIADMRDGKDDSAGNRQRRFQWRVTERQHTDGEHYKPSRAKHYGPPSAMSCPAGEKSQAARRHGNRQHHQVKGPADWNDAAKRGKGGKEEGQRETRSEEHTSELQSLRRR